MARFSAPLTLAEYRAQLVAIPAVAQWEKAARGSEGNLYPWGQEFSPDWLGSLQGRVAVGSRPEAASPYGVEDMVGNVWQWCQDNDDLPDDPGLDEQYLKQLRTIYRMVRGRSWHDSQRKSASQAAERYDLGFRAVFNYPPQLSGGG